jgi:AcrR family transcriptional regulator
MAYDTAQVALEVVKALILPAIGFVAGFAAQWILQARKSRDELVRALAEQRAEALRKLWEITTLPVELAALGASAEMPIDRREQLDRSILEWYTKQAGALFLSWSATQLLFRLLDLLRAEHTRKPELESAVSALRSRLKLDCGIYSASEARRQLSRPRPPPWNG